MALTVLWQSIALKHPMYERICASLALGDGGSKTVDWKLHKFTAIYFPFKNLPKCLERQNLTALIVDAIMCIFSKFTRPSMLVLLPSCANVISFSSNGIKGMTGGCSLPTDILWWCIVEQFRWSARQTEADEVERNEKRRNNFCEKLSAW